MSFLTCSAPFLAPLAAGHKALSPFVPQARAALAAL